MLWRLAFSALTLVLGLCLGAGLALYATQPEVNGLRNQIELQASAHAEAEALWNLQRTELTQAKLAAEAGADQSAERLANWKSVAETKAAAALEIREQLATCHNDLSMALSSVEGLRTELDNLYKNCSISGEE